MAVTGGHDPADSWDGQRRHAPAALRNREPIGDSLAGILPPSGTVLEVASGSGEHAVYLAHRFPALNWQPTDPDGDALASIAAWRATEGERLANLKAPLRLDASSADWPLSRADAVLCINMVHISPWPATEGLFAGAARILKPDSPLMIYGPFLADDIETAPSNLDFDRSLRMRDARWGLRNLADLDSVATLAGFARAGRHLLPANNMLLHYRRI